MTANNTNNNDTMIIPFRAFVRAHAQDTFQQAQKPANKYTWVPNPEIQQVRNQLRRWTDRFGICRGLLAGALSFLWISLVAYNYAWSLSFQTLLWGASSLTLFTALTMWYKHYMYQQVILDGQRELMYALQFISRQLAGSNDHD
jgi:hypothetical protein